MSQKPNTMFLVMMAILLVYMFFVMFRGPKKKQQEHQRMVQSLKKNDRVRTIGGIFGTVMDVRDDEIVLKIDESTNTKMRVSPAAIAAVLKDKTE
ncbi:MAG: preprotein translocase subunit YajC [Phycisphaerae bacterium]|nr:preprotein translocase subunit YajC [Phycisphaerae bacterium]